MASLDRSSGDITATSSPRNSFMKSGSPDIDRPGSRTSVNFSYPMSARPNSPPQSPAHERRQGSVELSSSPTLSPAETTSIQQSLTMTADRKVKTKSQRAAPGSIEGSHFAHKTMGSRPTGTALQDRTDEYEQEQAGQAEPQQRVPVPEDSPRSGVVVEDDGARAFDDANVRPQPKKRPSMVMEDNAGEELAEAADTVQQQVPTFESHTAHTPQSPESEDVTKAYHTPSIYPLQTSQTTVNHQARLSPSTSSAPSSPGDRLSVDHNIANKQLPERQPSTSPNRSARFSAQLTVSSNSPLHEPPSRSISPVKPALKNSSSPDRRIQLGRPPSEFSDGTSVASDEGSRTGSKKKIAKVSFDDEAEIVGVAASPPTSPEPLNRPQSPEKMKSKKWFSIGTKKSVTKDVTVDDEFESVLRPRPALPSFGSIRGVREPEDSTTTTAGYDDESDSSSDDDLGSSNLGASSDHAIGGILVNAHLREAENSSKQLQSKRADEYPHPELESSTAGHDESPSGPIESRSLGNTAVHHNLPTVIEEQGSTPPADPTITSPAQIAETVDSTVNDQKAEGLKEPVPIIAIQPATPGEDQRRSIDLRDMPGGFPSYLSDRTTPAQSSQNPSSPTEPLNQNFKEANPLIQEVGNDDDDDSGDSIYSDAAEDPTEFQGDVFGSINAIVDSPVPTETQLPLEVPDSPTRAKIRSDPMASIVESAPSPSLEAIHPRMPATPSPSPPQVPVTSDSPPAVTSQQQSMSESAGSAWPLKAVAKSSTSSSPSQSKSKDISSPSPHQGSHLRSALKQDKQHQQSLNKASSPSSIAPRSKRASTAEIKSNAPSRRQADIKPLPQSMTYPASMAKMRSDDSDSDSSFKRTRRSSRSAASGQYSMKRTMRANTLNSETFAEKSTPARASSMRTTMRGSPSERSSGFGSLRENSSRSRPRSTLISPNTRSRLGHSEDEGGTRRLFQSRFADSSDEDEPLSNLTPVRGIPRRQGKYDGESTDLDDSSDEEAKRQARNGAFKSSQPMTPEDIDRILSRPKKKGLFARLRSPTRSSGQDGKVLKSRIESPARRDTPLERSRSELARMREGELNTYSGRPTSPKLQKKQRSPFNDTWPLSSGQTSAFVATSRTATHDRPSTSDGIVNGSNAKSFIGGDSLRPNMNRHGTSDSIDSRVTSTASEVVVGHTGKKKRFPLLRKAFGLRD